MAPKVSSAHTHDTPGRKRAAVFACLDERSAMALEVPSALVPCVRETVLLQYQAAVGGAAARVPARGARRARRPQRCAEPASGWSSSARLLDQLGWPGEPVPPALEVAAPVDLLRDALHGALIDAGERLAVACEGSWRGEASPDGVRTAAGRGDRPRPPAAELGGAPLGGDGAAEQQDADHRDDGGQERHAPRTRTGRARRRDRHRAIAIPPARPGEGGCSRLRRVSWFVPPNSTFGEIDMPRDGRVAGAASLVSAN